MNQFEYQRNKEELEVMMERYHQMVYSFCYNMLRHQQEAEDATQDVFIKAFKSLSQNDLIMSQSSWLYKIAYHHCLNIIRKKKVIRFITFQSEIHSSLIADSSDDDSALIDSILLSLHPSDRSILILRILEQKSYEEISDILNIRITTARKRFERAKQRAKILLNHNERGNRNESITVL